MLWRPSLAVLALATTLLPLGGCGKDSPASGERPLVVATTGHVASLASQAAGPSAEVVQLIPEGADPHSFEPRPSDARALADADLVVRSGGEIDGWLDGLIDASGTEAPVVDLIGRVGAGEGGDPHWWQDPAKGVAAIAAIEEAIGAAAPSQAAAIAERARALSTRIESLDRRIAACVRKVPAADRVIVTAHDSLGQFASRYGIRVVGTVIPGRSSSAQASAGEVARLVKTIREAGVSTVFPEHAVRADLEREIAKRSGARVGPALYSDSLGSKGTPEATYLGALAHNARAILASLGTAASRCPLA